MLLFLRCSSDTDLPLAFNWALHLNKLNWVVLTSLDGGWRHSGSLHAYIWKAWVQILGTMSTAPLLGSCTIETRSWCLPNVRLAGWPEVCVKDGVLRTVSLAQKRQSHTLLVSIRGPYTDLKFMEPSVGNKNLVNVSLSAAPVELTCIPERNLPRLVLLLVSELLNNDGLMHLYISWIRSQICWFPRWNRYDNNFVW